MKAINKILVAAIPLAALLSACSHSKVNPANVRATMEFSETNYDYGRISQADTAAIHEFEVTNTGQQPLVIKDVASGCYCNRVEYPKQPIQPGETATFKIIFSPNKAYVGEFRKDIAIFSNTADGLDTFTIKGFVEPAK